MNYIASITSRIKLHFVFLYVSVLYYSFQFASPAVAIRFALHDTSLGHGAMVSEKMENTINSNHIGLWSVCMLNINREKIQFKMRAICHLLEGVKLKCMKRT